MKNKILGILLALLMIVSLFALTACDFGTMQGEQGEQGEPGEKGEQGEQGEQGEKGDAGVGIERVEYDADGNLVIIFTDGTKQTVTAPENGHTHSFGEWKLHNDARSCEDRLYYRICSACSGIEWRSGTYQDHDFEVVTASPTCEAGGYDTKTCKNCGLVEITNETSALDHDYSGSYLSDSSFHWSECKNCGATSEKVGHTLGDDGCCTICDATVGATAGLVYELSADGKSALLVAYEGTDKRIMIAEEYMGAPVTEICDKIFYYNQSITSVIIPDSVTHIGASAFEACTNLAEVKIGSKLIEIGDYAFYACAKLNGVVLPDSLTAIGRHAFNGCSSLAEIVIPDSLSYMGTKAFYACNSELYTVYKYCKYVKSGDNPYAVLIEVTNKNFSTYTIHEDAKILSYGTFSYCERLASISIPNGVTSILDHVFTACPALTDVALGSSLTHIGEYAFAACTSLADVVIPDSVTYIERMAFDGCSSLIRIVMGKGVSYLGEGAFNNCKKLANVYYTGTRAEWAAITIEVNQNSYFLNAVRHFGYVPEE